MPITKCGAGALVFTLFAQCVPQGSFMKYIYTTLQQQPRFKEQMCDMS